ncbi:MAG: CIA30 family protein [Gammaproteobacteria bacterium]|nr:MAG: CIA30 family protein [Gammaproteobacteria bacterium]
MTVFADDWRLITDNVMGGVSKGKLLRTEREGKKCTLLSGNVSTENNGGFIQIALDIDKSLAEKASAYEGVRVQVYGNAEQYNVHLRTRDLWLPWQAYRSSFYSAAKWQLVDLPFNAFTPYKTKTRLTISRLKRVGIVAIGRDFSADICVGPLGFYRS